jgi:hypothetical protein
MSKHHLQGVREGPEFPRSLPGMLLVAHSFLQILNQRAPRDRNQGLPPLRLVGVTSASISTLAHPVAHAGRNSPPGTHIMESGSKRTLGASPNWPDPV